MNFEPIPVSLISNDELVDLFYYQLRYISNTNYEDDRSLNRVIEAFRTEFKIRGYDNWQIELIIDEYTDKSSK